MSPADMYKANRADFDIHRRGNVQVNDPEMYHIVHLMVHDDCANRNERPMCWYGGWHMTYTRNPAKVTCQKCKERMSK